MECSLKQRLARIFAADIAEDVPLPVGFGLAGYAIRLADGRHLAVKAKLGPRASAAPPLTIEAEMLSALGRLSRLPVPAVRHAEHDLLVMDFIENDGGGITEAVQEHAAGLIADLHSVKGAAFGYPADTLIGPLPQPNRQSECWIAFFAENRLLAMARAAHEEGRLSARDLGRLESLAGRLEHYLGEPAYPALLHGDLWSGNILVKNNRVAGFVDPAISFGHPEIELAFTTMFGTFGPRFFDAYTALRPLEPGFFEIRKDIYNLYPSLVHLRLFGEAYLGGIHAVLTRLGL